jgi:hypothetical protein
VLIVTNLAASKVALNERAELAPSRFWWQWVYFLGIIQPLPYGDYVGTSADPDNLLFDEWDTIEVLLSFVGISVIWAIADALITAILPVLLLIHGISLGYSITVPYGAFCQLHALLFVG